MGRVSLILPIASGASLSTETVDACRQALESAGDAVEVLAVVGPDDTDSGVDVDADADWLKADAPGLASAAVAGLREATGDVLVVLDARHGYDAADVAKVVAALREAGADLVVGRRTAGPGQERRRLDACLGAVSKPILGASDPFSGLVALTPALARDFVGTFDPVGSRYTIDLLFRARGRKIEVPVRASVIRPSALGIDDLRHIKRLADDRFGTVSRLVQFCAVGASGMVVDLSCYALFQLVFSRTTLRTLTVPGLSGPLDLAVAGALSIALALVWNFSLNRRLTFNDARVGSVPRQFLAYVLSNALGIALSFSLRLYLPGHIDFFAKHRLAAAVVGIVMATGISFSMARWVVFHRRDGDTPRPAKPSDRDRLAKRKLAQSLNAR